MKIIVRNAGGRNIDHIKTAVPEDKLIIIHNEENAMSAFCEALEAAGDDSAVHMEDDIKLCNNFYQKLTEIINKAPNEVIQFFSMRKDDLAIGTRFISGRRFLMGQCFYLPKGMSKEIRAYKDTWKRIEEHPTGLDTMVADYLGDNKLAYLNIVPNLVDHLPVKSLINPRRSTKRQSLTFGKGE